MLVLNRKPGESILIGENIVLTVVGVHGSRVRLGVTAPMNVTVLRQEVFERLRHESAPQEQLPSSQA